LINNERWQIYSNQRLMLLLLKLVMASFWSRQVMAILTCTSICISMMVLIGVKYLYAEVKNYFDRTVSGVDWI